MTMTPLRSAPFRRLGLVLAVLALGVGLAGCGGDDDASTTTTDDTTTTTAETPATAGREIFVDNCGTCHALSDAGTSGTVGPSLDDSGLDVAAVEEQVRNGGGGMPAFEGQLSDEEIELVASYVAESSS
jgi:mono/diheme cytochrome c family protein